MHWLDRNNVTAPACLVAYQYPGHTWEDVSGESKIEIRTRLEEMQGRRCAYCEGPLDLLGQHIEHFRRKGNGHFPQLTFTWTNLYWSCDRADSCGHYKDRDAGAYDPDDLVDPCVDDPDQFFHFRSDGTINVRNGLSNDNRHRAEETLRVFNLNPLWGRLRNMRKAAVTPYLSMVDGAAGEFSPQELQEYFSDELAVAVASPFFTAIRHVLTEP